MRSEYNEYIKNHKTQPKFKFWFIISALLFFLALSSYFIQDYYLDKYNSLYGGSDNTEEQYQEQYQAKDRKDIFFGIMMFSGFLFATVFAITIASKYQLLSYDDWVEQQKKYLRDKAETQDLRNTITKKYNDSEIIPVEHEGELLRLRNQKIREVFDEELKIQTSIFEIKKLKARQGLDWSRYENELLTLDLELKKIEVALKAMPLYELQAKIKEYETVIKPRIYRALQGAKDEIGDYEG